MKKIIIQCVLLASVFGFVACDEGDDIWSKAASLQMIQDFDILNATQDTISVDFAKGETLPFVGEWNIETNWKVVIVGNESGKTDTIKGFSKSLEGISWTGNVGNGVQYFPYKLLNKKFNVDVFEESDEVTSFKQGEACTIMLSFDDFVGVDTSKTVLKIASAKEISYLKTDFCVFGDFESSNTKPLYQDATVTFEKSGDIVAGEGSTYCLLQGTETGNKWYIVGGGFSYPQTSGWTQLDGVYPITQEDTATTYINLMMYGFPGYCDHSSFYIALMNGESTEAGLTGDRIMVEEGWHGISIPVSHFAVKEGVFDYNKVDRIIFALFSNGEPGDVKCAVDCLVITKKAPLFPLYN